MVTTSFNENDVENAAMGMEEEEVVRDVVLRSASGSTHDYKFPQGENYTDQQMLDTVRATASDEVNDRSEIIWNDNISTATTRYGTITTPAQVKG